MSIISKLITLTLAAFIGVHAQAVCTGRFFLPTDIDPSHMSPFRIAGAAQFPIGVGPTMLPIQQYAVPPFMICPLFRPCVMTQIGGLPRELIETTPTAGCSTVLGVPLLPPQFGLLNGEAQGDEKQNGSVVQKIHTHQFKIDPLIPLGILPGGQGVGIGLGDILTAAACRQVGAFTLASMSEINPIVNTDALSAMKDPTKIPFSIIPAALCSIPDMISAEVSSYGLDACFGCMGDKGCRGMDSNNMGVADSHFKAQLAAAHVTTSRAYYDLAEWSTTGPWASCFSVPMPVVIKSESRYQNCGTSMPTCSAGRAQSVSGSHLMQLPPPDNTRPPAFENGYFVKYKGMNCCIGVGL